MKRLVAVALAATISSVAVAQTPLTSAQRNYKRCDAEDMPRGAELVAPICGVIPAEPRLPEYSRSDISATIVDASAQSRDAYAAQVRAYTRCIDTRVMGDGSLPTVTLDYAACAHQYAEEHVTRVVEGWQDRCIAYQDKINSTDISSCFPAG